MNKSEVFLEDEQGQKISPSVPDDSLIDISLNTVLGMGEGVIGIAEAIIFPVDEVILPIVNPFVDMLIMKLLIENLNESQKIMRTEAKQRMRDRRAAITTVRRIMRGEMGQAATARLAGSMIIALCTPQIGIARLPGLLTRLPKQTRTIKLINDFVKASKTAAAAHVKVKAPPDLDIPKSIIMPETIVRTAPFPELPLLKSPRLPTSDAPVYVSAQAMLAEGIKKSSKIDSPYNSMAFRYVLLEDGGLLFTRLKSDYVTPTVNNFVREHHFYDHGVLYVNQPGVVSVRSQSGFLGLLDRLIEKNQIAFDNAGIEVIMSDVYNLALRQSGSFHRLRQMAYPPGAFGDAYPLFTRIGSESKAIPYLSRREDILAHQSTHLNYGIFYRDNAKPELRFWGKTNTEPEAGLSNQTVYDYGVARFDDAGVKSVKSYLGLIDHEAQLQALAQKTFADYGLLNKSTKKFDFSINVTKSVDYHHTFYGIHNPSFKLHPKKIPFRQALLAEAGMPVMVANINLNPSDVIDFFIPRDNDQTYAFSDLFFSTAHAEPRQSFVEESYPVKEMESAKYIAESADEKYRQTSGELGLNKPDAVNFLGDSIFFPPDIAAKRLSYLWHDFVEHINTGAHYAKSTGKGVAHWLDDLFEVFPAVFSMAKDINLLSAAHQPPLLVSQDDISGAFVYSLLKEELANDSTSLREAHQRMNERKNNILGMIDTLKTFVFDTAVMAGKHVPLIPFADDISDQHVLSIMREVLVEHPDVYESSASRMMERKYVVAQALDAFKKLDGPDKAEVISHVAADFFGLGVLFQSGKVALKAGSMFPRLEHRSLVFRNRSPREKRDPLSVQFLTVEDIRRKKVIAKDIGADIPDALWILDANGEVKIADTLKNGYNLSDYPSYNDIPTKLINHSEMSDGKPIRIGGEMNFARTAEGKIEIETFNNRTGHYHTRFSEMRHEAEGAIVDFGLAEARSTFREKFDIKDYPLPWLQMPYLSDFMPGLNGIFFSALGGAGIRMVSEHKISTNNPPYHSGMSRDNGQTYTFSDLFFSTAHAEPRQLSLLSTVEESYPVKENSINSDDESVEFYFRHLSTSEASDEIFPDPRLIVHNLAESIMPVVPAVTSISFWPLATKDFFRVASPHKTTVKRKTRSKLPQYRVVNPLPKAFIIPSLDTAAQGNYYYAIMPKAKLADRLLLMPMRGSIIPTDAHLMVHLSSSKFFSGPLTWEESIQKNVFTDTGIIKIKKGRVKKVSSFIATEKTLPKFQREMEKALARDKYNFDNSFYRRAPESVAKRIIGGTLLEEVDVTKKIKPTADAVKPTVVFNKNLNAKLKVLKAIGFVGMVIPLAEAAEKVYGSNKPAEEVLHQVSLLSAAAWGSARAAQMALPFCSKLPGLGFPTCMLAASAIGAVTVAYPTELAWQKGVKPLLEDVDVSQFSIEPGMNFSEPLPGKSVLWLDQHESNDEPTLLGKNEISPRAESVLLAEQASDEEQKQALDARHQPSTFSFGSLFFGEAQAAPLPAKPADVVDAPVPRTVQAIHIVGPLIDNNNSLQAAHGVPIIESGPAVNLYAALGVDKIFPMAAENIRGISPTFSFIDLLPAEESAPIAVQPSFAEISGINKADISYYAGDYHEVLNEQQFQELHDLSDEEMLLFKKLNAVDGKATAGLKNHLPSNSLKNNLQDLSHQTMEDINKGLESHILNYLQNNMKTINLGDIAKHKLPSNSLSLGLHAVALSQVVAGAARITGNRPMAVKFQALGNAVLCASYFSHTNDRWEKTLALGQGISSIFSLAGDNKTARMVGNVASATFGIAQAVTSFATGNILMGLGGLCSALSIFGGDDDGLEAISGQIVQLNQTVVHGFNQVLEKQHNTMQLIAESDARHKQRFDQIDQGIIKTQRLIGESCRRILMLVDERTEFLRLQQNENHLEVMNNLQKMQDNILSTVKKLGELVSRGFTLLSKQVEANHWDLSIQLERMQLQHESAFLHLVRHNIRQAENQQLLLIKNNELILHARRSACENKANYFLQQKQEGEKLADTILKPSFKFKEQENYLAQLDQAIDQCDLQRLTNCTVISKEILPDSSQNSGPFDNLHFLWLYGGKQFSDLPFKHPLALMKNLRALMKYWQTMKIPLREVTEDYEKYRGELVRFFRFAEFIATKNFIRSAVESISNQIQNFWLKAAIYLQSYQNDILEEWRSDQQSFLASYQNQWLAKKEELPRDLQQHLLRTEKDCQTQLKEMTWNLLGNELEVSDNLLPMAFYARPVAHSHIELLLPEPARHIKLPRDLLRLEALGAGRIIFSYCFDESSERVEIWPEFHSLYVPDDNFFILPSVSFNLTAKDKLLTVWEGFSASLEELPEKNIEIKENFAKLLDLQVDYLQQKLVMKFQQAVDLQADADNIFMEQSGLRLALQFAFANVCENPLFPVKEVLNEIKPDQSLWSELQKQAGVFPHPCAQSMEQQQHWMKLAERLIDAIESQTLYPEPPILLSLLREFDYFYLDQLELSDALAWCDSHFNQSPTMDLVPALEIVGARAFAEKQFASALICYKRIVDLQPDNQAAHYQEVLCLKNLGNLPAAIERADMILKKLDEFGASFAWLMANPLLSYNPQQSQVILDGVLLNLFSVVKLQGDFLAENNQLNEALKYYGMARNILPNNVALTLAVAQVYIRQGNWPMVLDTCEQALKTESAHSEVLRAKATALRQLQKFNEALTVYEILLDKNPDNTDPFYHAMLTFVTSKESHLFSKEKLTKLFQQLLTYLQSDHQSVPAKDLQTCLIHLEDIKPSLEIGSGIYGVIRLLENRLRSPASVGKTLKSVKHEHKIASLKERLLQKASQVYQEKKTPLVKNSVFSSNQPLEENSFLLRKENRC